MENVFRRTVIISLIAGAFSTVFLMLTPLEIIPCKTRQIYPGAVYENSQCSGYLANKINFSKVPGTPAIDYNLLLLYSILIIGGIILSTFFVSLITLYMKAGREPKL
ncbi:hypothetical protein JW978_02710 [Candidatus Dojkabacteria bacterium]|nr:hypothetical protein [Candidatus Dojkabacteria bacterium]